MKISSAYNSQNIKLFPQNSFKGWHKGISEISTLKADLFLNTHKKSPKSFKNRLTASVKKFFTECFFSNFTPAKKKHFTKSFLRESEILSNLDRGFKDYDETDYHILSKEALAQARSICKYTAPIVEENFHYSTLLKKYLDENYGVNKYIFVSVGRSPSTIARCMEKMDIPVVYCPISELREPELSKFKYTVGYRIYLDFLEASGLKPDKINKSGKKLLVYDYTESGESLKTFGKLLTECLGINKNKVDLRSVNEDILKVAKNPSDAAKFICKMFEDCGAEQYGGIPELPWYFVRRINLTEENQKGYNQFKFILQDKLERKK